MTESQRRCSCAEQPPGNDGGGRTLWVSAAVSLVTKVVADVIGKWLS